MAAIRRELEAGGTKTRAARDHNIGTIQRLNRLLAKWPTQTEDSAPSPSSLSSAKVLAPAPPPPAEDPAPSSAPWLSDTEVDALLEGLV